MALFLCQRADGDEAWNPNTLRGAVEHKLASLIQVAESSEVLIIIQTADLDRTKFLVTPTGALIHRGAVSPAAFLAPWQQDASVGRKGAEADDDTTTTRIFVRTRSGRSTHKKPERDNTEFVRVGSVSGRLQAKVQGTGGKF